MPPRRVFGTVERATPAALAALALTLSVGCYSTTPHRAEVATRAAPQACEAAVTDVFSRSGFVQLPTPPRLSMFFSARVDGPYSSFMSTGVGVGVTIDRAGQAAGDCRVTIEALSPDVNCVDQHVPQTCRGLSAPVVGSRPYTDDGFPRCPITPTLACDLSYAPGADNDAAVDELARRVRATLGPRSAVN